MAAGICSSAHVVGLRGRQLLQAPDPSKSFPFCRCTDYSWSSSPYTLTLESATPLTSIPASTQFCMRLAVQPCADASSTCCGLLKKSLHKIDIETGERPGWQAVQGRQAREVHGTECMARGLGSMVSCVWGVVSYVGGNVPPVLCPSRLPPLASVPFGPCST